MTDSRVWWQLDFNEVRSSYLPVPMNHLDVAISAPFQKSGGVVYIYHGQERDSSGSIINTSPKQVIETSIIIIITY